MTAIDVQLNDFEHTRCMAANDALDYLKEQFDGAGQWFAEISRDGNTYLSLTKFSSRSIVLIFVEREPYRALDASVSETFDARRRTLIFEGSETIVPANIVIGKVAAFRAVSHYVLRGSLDENLYWLPDGKG